MYAAVMNFQDYPNLYYFFPAFRLPARILDGEKIILTYILNEKKNL